MTLLNALTCELIDMQDKDIRSCILLDIMQSCLEASGLDNKPTMRVNADFTWTLPNDQAELNTAT